MSEKCASLIFDPCSSAREVAEVDEREDVVLLFQAPQPGLVEPVLLHGVEQPVEAIDVLAHAALGITDHRPHRDDERPVARAREHHLARHLIERALLEPARTASLTRDPGHLFADAMHVDPDPVVAVVATELAVAL